MKNEIRFTLESKQRPKLAQEIGNILGTAPHYERVPSCAYDIAGYRLDKEGVLYIPDGAEETTKDLILHLRERGFQDDAEITEEVPVQQDKLTIVIPRESITDMALENLQKIIANKQILFQRAFRTDNTEIEITDEKINFTWFPYTADGDELAAYTQFISNGKGTLMESTLHVMGDYGLTVRPETIAAKPSANSQNPTEDIARLAGVRFANISEPRRGLVLNEAQIKSMTGNDTLNARFLHENSFDFKPQFKLYVNTNYLPAITDMTLFSSGRIVIIPFDRHFEEWEQEQNLKAEFSRPKAASAILNWLIEGYTILKEEGFAQPKAVKDATMSYQHDSDKMELFVEEFLEQEKDAECRTSAVYQAYRNWCNDNGYFAENSRNFNQALRTIGTVVRKRPRDGGEKTTLLTGYRLLCRDFLC